MMRSRFIQGIAGVVIAAVLCAPSFALALESTSTPQVVSLDATSVAALASAIATELAGTSLHLDPDTSVLATVTAAPATSIESSVSIAGPIEVTPFGLKTDVIPALVAFSGLAVGWGVHRAWFA